MRTSLRNPWMPLFMAGVITAAVPSATQGQIEPGASASFLSPASAVRPNVDLPPQVVAPEGKLTLFTDFANATEVGCPVYLVNRTGESLTLPMQDGSLPLKLTHALDNGTWQRAQAHSYSNCGNSFMFPVQLEPGQFVKSTGYVPVRGNNGKIRYQLFHAIEGELVSNEGSGRWDPQDVTDSLNDELAARDEIKQPGAILEISAIPLVDPSRRREMMEDGIACLDLISGGRAAYRCREGLQFLEAVLDPPGYVTSGPNWPALLLPPEDLDKARARMEEIATHPAAADVSPAAFMRLCLGLIRSSDSSEPLGFGRPENRPWIAWEVLEKLAGTRDAADTRQSEDWKEIFELAQARIATAGDREKNAIGNLFECHALVAEHVQTPVLIANVKSGSPVLSDACISQLHYLQAYSDLARLGLEADIALRRRIMRFFCMAPSLPHELRTERADPVQRKFFELCVKDDPWVSYLWMGSEFLSPWDAKSGISANYQTAFAEVLEASEKGAFPVTEPLSSEGLRKYLRFVSAIPDQTFDSPLETCGRTGGQRTSGRTRRFRKGPG